MGIFSRWNNASGFELTSDDLATCEGYVTADALRKLQLAKVEAHGGQASSLFSLAHLVASRIADVAAFVADRGLSVPPAEPVAPPAQATRAEGAPVAVLSEAASPSRPRPAAPVVGEGRVDKAA